ncbi:MAG TPA: SDR family NAD(P)-dependent oxidoreductase [Acidimicrobiales bacterium]|jgi:NAD(P)-dependent dehydrogenase (short-subunit alcohol dehydrogenase family)
MDLQLSGKRALITGSTSGIGEATARFLAKEGVAVAVHGRSAERAERVTAEINAAGGTAVAAVGDLTDPEAATQVAATVDAAFGGVDILFNNAGGGGRDPARTDTTFLALEPEDWLGEYQHNVVTAVRMIRHFVPGMCTRGWGRVIQNASAVATTPRNWENDYAVAKAAVVNLSVGLSKALARSGVTVNTVSPGLILTSAQTTGETPWLRTFARSQGWDDSLPIEELEAMWAASRGIPAGHAGRVEDIAAMVALLASPLGGFVNGANIRVDGGQNQAIN